jgi:hypothetical protein
MKLTKQKLIEIIKEEMGSIESLSGVESDPEVTGEDEGVSSRSELGKKFIKLGKEVPKMSDLDAAEAALIDNFLNLIIQSSNDDNAKTNLMAALKFANQKLGE